MSAVRALSADDALALRLRGQGLDVRAPARRLIDVCGAIGGAQAQVGSAARISLSARVAGLTDARVRAAVDRDRTLVKTWTVRGTLHLVPARDLALFVAALGPTRRKRAGSWLERCGMSARTLDALTVDIVEALADGPLNRRQIAERVGDAHGAQARKLLENSWGGVFHCVTNLGLVCFGPSVAGQTTFVRIDQWLGAPLAAAEPAAAEAELARRFVRAFGPATMADFTYWAGLYAPDARRMWDRIERELVPVTVAGRPAFIHSRAKAPAASRAPRAGVPHARLLPNFDAFLLGHRDKNACLEPLRYKKVFKNAGWISPVVLLDGRVAGTWSLERKGAGLVARVAAFAPLDRAARTAVAAEAEALGAFAGLAARVRYGPPERRKVPVPWTVP